MLANLFGIADDLPRLFTDAGRKALASKGFFRGSPLFESLSAGKSAALGGMILQVPLAMYSAGQAEREHKVSTFAATTFPMVGTGLMTAAFGGVIGAAAGMILDPLISKTVGRGVQALHDFGRNSTRINTGGNYHDTQVAYTQRQAACQEMSRSLLNARQYLGKESVFLHS